jgi:hypothetical protein
MNESAKIIVIKRGSRYIPVVYYGNEGGIGRKGYWCADRQGGWGVSSLSENKAIDQCASPATYRSRKKAIEDTVI